MTTTLNINGASHEVDADPDMPLLWAIRDLAHLPGTKYGCGKALCGAYVSIDEQQPWPPEGYDDQQLCASCAELAAL